MKLTPQAYGGWAHPDKSSNGMWRRWAIWRSGRRVIHDRFEPRYGKPGWDSFRYLGKRLSVTVDWRQKPDAR